MNDKVMIWFVVVWFLEKGVWWWMKEGNVNKSTNLVILTNKILSGQR